MQIQSELQKIQQRDNKQTKDKEKTEWAPKVEGEVEVERVKTQEQTETVASEIEGKGLKKVEKEVSALDLLKRFNNAQKMNKSKQTQKTRYKKRQPIKAQASRMAPKGWATKITDPDQLHIVS